MSREAPLYVQTHDMLAWLIPHLESWPRAQRFLLAREVLESATAFYRLLLRARKTVGQERAAALLEADVELETLRALLRLGQERQYMSLDQYAHISRILVELGKQLGGWRAKLSADFQPPAVGTGS
ncbi:MAG: hypothetical protein BWY25_02507 [Chloroflexi bacterium ADurb.Bin222]|nr:MAG: hypothetical protein BWY25_02507 [Chloroflexi bacterium ADurb.Bin222]